MVPSESVSPSQNPSDVPTESNGPSIKPSSTPAMILCRRGSGLNFAAHEAAANLLYGNVASIHSAEENWLVSYIGGQAYIGFVDYGLAFDFVWSDGSDVNFTSWNSGEPNGITEDCTITAHGNPNTWNNVQCSDGRAAVYKLPFSSRCDAMAMATAGYTCYEGDSTGCSSSFNCKTALTAC
jgi:hypothetical protein